MRTPGSVTELEAVEMLFSGEYDGLTAGEFAARYPLLVTTDTDQPKIYVSGPIKDVVDFEYLFAKGEERCRACGYEVVNPCTIVHIDNATYEDFMRADIKGMLDCDAIYLLKGWERSNGARVEFTVAVACGMQIFYQGGGASMDVDLLPNHRIGHGFRPNR